LVIYRACLTCVSPLEINGAVFAPAKAVPVHKISEEGGEASFCSSQFELNRCLLSLEGRAPFHSTLVGDFYYCSAVTITALLLVMFYTAENKRA